MQGCNSTIELVHPSHLPDSSSPNREGQPGGLSQQRQGGATQRSLNTSVAKKILAF